MWVLLLYCLLSLDTTLAQYTFNIRNDRTMLYRPKDTPGKAYKITLNGTRLQIQESIFLRAPHPLLNQFVDDLNDVITADGVSRNIMTINGQFPGPTIEVEQDQEVVVKVVNWLRTDGVTIHWHGIWHKGTMWMDGAAHVTQCPISPYQSFTYRFKAYPPGTHWYHAHNGPQRIDGLSGMLIIHPKFSVQPQGFSLMVTDWLHEQGITLEMTNPYSQEKGDKGAGEHVHAHPTIRDYGPDGVETSGIQFVSGLINGRGRFNGQPLPLERFLVKPGQSYRFRSVNSGGEYSFSLSIDTHLLKVVALDGIEIVPYTVNEAVIAPGETLDFEINANSTTGLYWLRARTLLDLTSGKQPREVLAVVQYEGASLTADPISTPENCTTSNQCKILNCPFQNYPPVFGKKCINVAEMRTIENSTELEKVLSMDVDQELFLNAGFNWGSSINARKMLVSNAPLFMKNRRMADCSSLCSDQSMGCVCSGNYSIRTGISVQLVLSNLQYSESLIAHHPMHLHGHTFAVLKIGYGTYDKSGKYDGHTPDVICADSVCRTPRWNSTLNDKQLNLKNPPLKNTIVVPARGYVVVRFKSDNPGQWLYHCHAISHNLEGMAVLLMEGSEESLPPVPANFPTCYGWNGNEEPEESNSSFSIDLKLLGIIVGSILGGMIFPLVIVCLVRKVKKVGVME